MTALSERSRHSVAGQRFGAIAYLSSPKCGAQEVSPEKEKRRNNTFLKREEKKKTRTGMTDDPPPCQNGKSKFEKKGEEGAESAMGWMHN